MNQKLLGMILLSLGVFLIVSVYSYTSEILAMSTELHKNCPLPDEVCPYKRAVPIESYHGYFLSGMVALIGGYFIVSKRGLEKVVVEKSSAADKSKIKKVGESLEGEEKQVFQVLAGSDGAMFQSDIMQKTSFSKVKTSRILDKLELKGLVERRRRGMSNLVVMKAY